MTDSDAGFPEDMRRFLADLGIQGQDLRARPLTGGVSSDIWFVEVDGRAVCIKRALPTLRVAAHWTAPVERSGFEYAWFERVREIAPATVPPLIGRHASGNMFAMAFLPADRYPVWKALLLRGTVDAAFAAAVGEILGAIHAGTAGDGRTAGAFATDASFHALRLEPYLLATARRHPDLADRLQAIAATTGTTKLALVHGDVSPKNILAGPEGPVILDAECAWYGDPAFDLAFCLNHLLLKCLPVRDRTGLLMDAFDRMAGAYLPHVSWEDAAAFESRCAALLPALLLARVDGKSPVEYVTGETDREIVRGVARGLVAEPPDRLSTVRHRWLDGLRH
ncbi:aminoglycoside phosphotransferase family protein [Skermanella sp. TT6]|uniref:Aminoglycoside phosphotransferase family protein n=1 Tax=Skermanella cutis TaxID=2775420 RepID=A0ABX7BA89_9PROT|nr:aminoglycoside phosphotransferase family protein [Skermanella sp. TT6]QQP91289.1 aminoglycoside phosphotransferase family protein [Skermanella sp. TT6]